VVAIALQALLALAMMATASFEALLSYIGFTLSLFAALAVAGVFRLRRAGLAEIGLVEHDDLRFFRERRRVASQLAVERVEVRQRLVGVGRFDVLGADLLVRDEVVRVNRSLLDDELLRGAQIRKFLILHKELDPDDEEITRTRKVRRGYIAQKYAAMIEALYGDREHVEVEAKVTYEDGRTGIVRADVIIREADVFAGTGAR
jgi:hypothetical protein